MATYTVMGLAHDAEQLEKTLTEVDSAGFGREQLSVVTQENVVQKHLGGDPREFVGESAAAGILGGTAIGGLIGILAGASLLVVPGIGPVVAAGSVSAAISAAATGAGIGAAYGGILGALIGLGMSEEDAHRYVEHVRRGSTLLALEVPEDRVTEAQSALTRGGATAIEARLARWQVEEDQDVPVGEEVEASDPHLAETLDQLITLCKEGQKSFQIAARNVRRDEMVRFFDGYAGRCADFVAALQKEVRRLGAEPAGEPLLSDAIRRGWENFRASMTIEEDRTTRQVLSATQQRTEELARAYDQALDRPLPDGVRSLLESQYAEIRKVQAQIQDLETLFDGDEPR
jgi:uncharacterized protein (TIGR02284 family)